MIQPADSSQQAKSYLRLRSLFHAWHVIGFTLPLKLNFSIIFDYEIFPRTIYRSVRYNQQPTPESQCTDTQTHFGIRANQSNEID